MFYKNLYLTHTQNDKSITEREVYENQNLPRGQFRSPVSSSSRGMYSLSRLPASLSHHPQPLPGSLCLFHRDVHSLSSHFLPCPLPESVYDSYPFTDSLIFSPSVSLSPTPHFQERIFAFKIDSERVRHIIYIVAQGMEMCLDLCLYKNIFIVETKASCINIYPYYK